MGQQMHHRDCCAASSAHSEAHLLWCWALVMVVTQVVKVVGVVVGAAHV